jgi:hypothetical protein
MEENCASYLFQKNLTDFLLAANSGDVSVAPLLAPARDRIEPTLARQLPIATIAGFRCLLH